MIFILRSSRKPRIMSYEMRQKLKKDCMEFMSEGTVESNGWKPKNCRIHNYTEM